MGVGQPWRMELSGDHDSNSQAGHEDSASGGEHMNDSVGRV